MKVAEFYEKLAKLPEQGWQAFIYPDLNIRLKKSSKKTKGFRNFCPITAVYCQETGKAISIAQTCCAISELNLPEKSADLIMFGADGDLGKTRTKILRALGLKELPEEE